MAAFFIDTTDHQIMDYFNLQAHPYFAEMGIAWPSNAFSNGVDGWLEGSPIVRLQDTQPPSTQPWQVAVKDTPQYKIVEGEYEWNWIVRNMTQLELDAVNALNKSNNDSLRQMRYDQEADPLFFMAQRQETTTQEWLDKIEQIRNELPSPAIISIP